MKRVFQIFAVIALLALVAAVSGGLSLWHHIGSHPDMSISINGDEVLLGSLDIGDLVGGIIGLAVAAFVVLIVVPLALLLGIGLPLLIVGGMMAIGVLAVVGIGAVVFSPLLLLVGILWLALRRKPAKTTTPPPQPVTAPTEPTLAHD
ncbi:hypothetical protein [Pelomonas sp. SE-A7]|uniref:hypothetical protein n=1 Tax=Pelomonas sp. SE-A7 TaxID=3054953 RepID=UPI00259CA303|nr:hypothetical protein [Pelomonas sp. SE-A7]MDM4768091.1 hypothetical protein [Pelomonas sp. SE-A7]